MQRKKETPLSTYDARECFILQVLPANYTVASSSQLYDSTCGERNLDYNKHIGAAFLHYV